MRPYFSTTTIVRVAQKLLKYMETTLQQNELRAMKIEVHIKYNRR
jgi:hypothetical protein